MNPKTSHLALWLVACVLALAGPALAQDTGTLEGTVLVEGELIAGARVNVESAASSSFLAEEVSDAEGRFEIAGVPVGNFTVWVYGADDTLLAEGTGTLIEAGETIRVHLAPIP